MSYTKGPWVYSKHRATHDCCIHQVGADDSKYGYIQPDEGGVVGSSEWIWINDDDGYLIAAAPVLLEALQNMLGAFDNPIVRRKYRDEFTDAAIASARDAIEAATQTKSEEVQ